MTYLEAFKQAARERGVSAEQIESRIRRSNFIFGPPPEHARREIPPEQERAVIDAFRLMLGKAEQAVKQNPEGMRQWILDRMRTRQKKN